jgi:hypothetical protein
MFAICAVFVKGKEKNRNNEGRIKMEKGHCLSFHLFYVELAYRSQLFSSFCLVLIPRRL